MRRVVGRVLSLLLCMVLVVGLCACTSGSVSGQEASVGVTVDGQGQEASYPPTLQEDGGKLRIGLLDINEYEPASIYLYYVIQGLKNEGWIEFDTLPFTETSMDVVAMVQALSEMDLGPYVEFVGDAAYYSEYQSEEEIVASMQAHIDSEEGLDIILAMGTDPGLFMQRHSDLDVNVLVCMATDPVASGIINSTEDSGDPQVWAQVEPLPYYRQIKFYHNIIPFENIGMVYTDPVVAGISDYQNGADELGIQITGELVQEQGDMTNEEYADLLLDTYDSLIERNIDAYMLNADLVTSDMELAPLIEPFLSAGIPVFVQDGENYVREGALLLVASTDNEGVGQFVAETIAQVASGVQPGEIPCEYVSSPYMSINLDTAKRIGFRPSFEILLSCETIYSSTAEGGAGE
ncbi:MAG: ABC transporter substrate binding protein [Candidatus Spyradocola sp.]|jgi:ABC-type uncharacterized transport system substrate-binding protein